MDTTSTKSLDELIVNFDSISPIYLREHTGKEFIGELQWSPKSQSLIFHDPDWCQLDFSVRTVAKLYREDNKLLLENNLDKEITMTRAANMFHNIPPHEKVALFNLAGEEYNELLIPVADE